MYGSTEPLGLHFPPKADVKRDYTALTTLLDAATADILDCHRRDKWHIFIVETTSGTEADPRDGNLDYQALVAPVAGYDRAFLLVEVALRIRPHLTVLKVTAGTLARRIKEDSTGVFLFFLAYVLLGQAGVLELTILILTGKLGANRKLSLADAYKYIVKLGYRRFLLTHGNADELAHEVMDVKHVRFTDFVTALNLGKLTYRYGSGALAVSMMTVPQNLGVSKDDAPSVIPRETIEKVKDDPNLLRYYQNFRTYHARLHVKDYFGRATGFAVSEKRSKAAAGSMAKTKNISDLVLDLNDKIHRRKWKE